MSTCSAVKIGCQAEAVQEILIANEWRPMCQEHIDLALKISAENTMNLGETMLVYIPPTRELSS